MSEFRGPWGRAYNLVHDYPASCWVHPLKQESVGRFIDLCLQEHPEVRRIVVFGSAVSEWCRPDSDVDFMVNGVRGIVHSPVDEEWDVLYAEELDPESLICQEVLHDGLVVYGPTD